MMRRILMLILTGALVGLLAGPAASNGRGSVYERNRYDDPYAYTDKECGFPMEVRGRARGLSVIHNVRGSGGEAFLADNRFRFRDVLTNPRNGKKMYVSGHGRFRERTAEHVEDDVWEFIQVERGRPFVVKNARKKIVLADHGKVILRQVFDTLGDSQPGGEEVDFEVLRVVRGKFPSYDPDFDFCRLARRLIG